MKPFRPRVTDYAGPAECSRSRNNRPHNDPLSTTIGQRDRPALWSSLHGVRPQSSKSRLAASPRLCAAHSHSREFTDSFDEVFRVMASRLFAPVPAENSSGVHFRRRLG